MEEAFQLCDDIIIMHKGNKIMEGNPSELLDKNIEKHVLEILNFELIKPECLNATNDKIRMENSPGVMRYYCDDLNLLKEFADSCLDSGNYLIRQTNLEDIFLHATGRQLND